MHRYVSSARVDESAPAGAAESYPEAGPRRRFRLGGVAHVAFSAVLAVGAVAYATVLRPGAPPRTPVRVEEVTAAVVGSRQLAVTVTVRNTNPEAKTARVWWLLAVPGTGPEWDRRAYRSSARTVALDPGGTADLAWDEGAQVPGGLYAVSAWVHVEGANGFTHEDGRVATVVDVGAPVDGEPGDALLRAGPPRFHVNVAQVTAPAAAGRPASVVLRNATDHAQRGLVRWGVFPVVENVPSDWWRHPATWWGRSVAVDLEPGEMREVVLGVLAVGQTGRYGLRVVLDSTARDAGGPLDDVALPTPVVVSPPGP